MYRMGLIDFWYYTNEEFYFKNGHILLRGSNGSGKSVTMQSFIPILLDGNKNSERLDAFGTKARKMETYLIDENSNRDERIAYLYLEFKREDCNGVQREHNKKLNNGLPILHKVPPKRDYGRYFCIMAEKGGTSHGGLTEKLSLFFHAKKQEVNAYGR